MRDQLSLRASEVFSKVGRTGSVLFATKRRTEPVLPTKAEASFGVLDPKRIKHPRGKPRGIQKVAADLRAAICLLCNGRSEIDRYHCRFLGFLELTPGARFGN